MNVIDPGRLSKLNAKVYAAQRDVTTSQQASNLRVSMDQCNDSEMRKRQLIFQDDASLHRLDRILQKRTEMRTYLVVSFQGLSN